MNAVARGPEPTWRALWRWRRGRQGTHYFKMLLAQGSFWDCYLLRYPVGSHVPLHHDPVHGKRHYRLNVTLVGSPDAVELFGPALARGWRWLFFRPDVISHRVHHVDRRRLVLSIGWVRPEKDADR